VVWDPVSAAVAHDVQCAGSGITTVYDSLVLGAAPGWEMRDEWLRPMLEGLASARSLGMLKGDHRLHLRCEVTHPDIVPFLERFLASRGSGFLSFMDHAPGDRQSPDVEAYKARYRSSFGMDEAAVDAHVAALVEGSGGTRRGTAGSWRRLLGRAASRSPATTTRARSTSWRPPSWAPC
jgi:alpha-D-ribose 1-methylphosphonate 5-triphosphate diphosphatase